MQLPARDGEVRSRHGDHRVAGEEPDREHTRLRQRRGQSARLLDRSSRSGSAPRLRPGRRRGSPAGSTCETRAAPPPAPRDAASCRAAASSRSSSRATSLIRSYSGCRGREGPEWILPGQPRHRDASAIAVPARRPLDGVREPIGPDHPAAPPRPVHPRIAVSARSRSNRAEARSSRPNRIDRAARSRALSAAISRPPSASAPTPARQGRTRAAAAPGSRPATPSAGRAPRARSSPAIPRRSTPSANSLH